MKHRVIIVEDDDIIRQLFSTLISTSEGLELAGAFGSADKALKEIAPLTPDVVLMDIELPGTNGIDAIPLIKKQLPNCLIIVVTVYENDELVFKALCNGASGYLTKNVKSEKLIESIHEVLKGGAPMSSNIARLVVSSFHRNINSNPLTPREQEVLELLASGKSYTSIADKLFVDKETIRTHIKNIYVKLEVHSKADAIAKAKKDRLI
jgi:DNA-binding NarL/FixJ family response regulator